MRETSRVTSVSGAPGGVSTKPRSSETEPLDDAVAGKINRVDFGRIVVEYDEIGRGAFGKRWLRKSEETRWVRRRHRDGIGEVEPAELHQIGDAAIHLQRRPGEFF